MSECVCANTRVSTFVNMCALVRIPKHVCTPVHTCAHIHNNVSLLLDAFDYTYVFLCVHICRFVFSMWRSDAECAWNISTDANSIVRLSVAAIDLEEGSTCQYDYMSVYDGGTFLKPSLCVVGRVFVLFCFLFAGMF